MQLKDGYYQYNAGRIQKVWPWQKNLPLGTADLHQSAVTLLCLIFNHEIIPRCGE